MPVITLGITILLAIVFPIDIMLLSRLDRMYDLTFIQGKLFWLYFFVRYIPAVIAAIVFVRMAGLKSRLPKNFPGKMTILVAVALMVLHQAWYLFATFLPVQIYAPFLTLLIRILLVIGVTKALLVASPRQSA